MNEKYHSIQHEPAHGAPRSAGSGPPEPEPSATERRDDIDAVRDSVAAEPFSAESQQHFGQWLARRAAETSLAGNLMVTLVAALLSGPAAVVGAFTTVGPTWVAALYLVLVGPIVEELFKQSGMTFVLERMPYRIFSGWQFVFGGVVGGLVFAAIENWMYLHVYAVEQEVDLEALAAFRWTVCVALHVGCSALASLGLARAWSRMHRLGRPPHLADGSPFLIAAVAIHGAFNLWAMLAGPEF